MKVTVAIEAVLILVLANFGVRLVRETKRLDSRADTLRVIVSSNQGMPFESIAGIDAFGQMVNSATPPGVSRFVVFGIRGSTLQRDLSFWNSVAALLPKNGGVSLIGFCTGGGCADGLRNTSQRLSFPVIAYGEAGSSQAVVNADARGNLILLSGTLATMGSLPWRRLDVTPSTIVRGVLP